jgi:hypothetical protein
MTRYLTLAELNDGLPEILRLLKDDGRLTAIVIRPEQGVRRELDGCALSLARGTHGDRWARAGGPPLPDISRSAS